MAHNRNTIKRILSRSLEELKVEAFVVFLSPSFYVHLQIAKKKHILKQSHGH